MPTTSASLYEQLFALSTVMKQRFVENFSGDTLNERWTTRILRTAATFAMNDVVDGGFRITVGAGATNEGSIDFNGIHQFSNTGAVMITVAQHSSGSGVTIPCGWCNDEVIVIDTGRTDFANFESQGATWRNFTADASTASATSGSISDTASTWFVFKSELGASDHKTTIDGVLDITKTTNLPTVKLQPQLAVGNVANMTLDLRYCEAYNT